MASTTISRLKRTQSFLIAFALILGAVGLGFVIHGIHTFGLSDKNNLNLLGDYLGGTTGSFWSAAGLIVVYLAFIAQKLQLEMQNDEINATKSGLEKQVFETTFFNLLNLFSSNVRDIDMHVSNTQIRGKDCLRAIMNDFKSDFNSADGSTTDEKIKNAFDELLSKHSLDISTYFNSMLPLIILIENKSGEEYKYYSSILASQLSNYETALLYYYSLTDFRFSDFVLKNQILNKVKDSPNSGALLFT